MKRYQALKVAFAVSLMLTLIAAASFLALLTSNIPNIVRYEGSLPNYPNSCTTHVLQELSPGDKVYIVSNLPASISATPEPRDAFIKLPYEVEGRKIDFTPSLLWANRTLLLAKSETKNTILRICLTNYVYSFVIVPFEGNPSWKIIEADKELTLKVYSQDTSKRFTQALIVLNTSPIKVSQDFKLEGDVKLVNGKIGYINLVLITEDGMIGVNILKSSETQITKHFVIYAKAETLEGKTVNLEGKVLKVIGISIGLDSLQWKNELPYAVIQLKNITLHNFGKNEAIHLGKINSSTVRYNIYVIKKYQQNIIMCLQLALLASSATTALLTLYALTRNS